MRSNASKGRPICVATIWVSKFLAVAVIVLLVSPNLTTPIQAAAEDLDPCFGTGGKVSTNFGSLSEEVNAIAIQADGKIVVAGSNDSDFLLARYNSNGSLDTSFGIEGKVITDFSTPTRSRGDIATAIAIQDNGRIVVAGYSSFSSAESSFSDFALARYNSNGSLDTSFGIEGKVITDFSVDNREQALAVAIQGDNKIVAAGFIARTSNTTTNFDFALARYNSDGSLDSNADADPASSFGTSGMITTDFGSLRDEAHGIAIQSDGKMVAAGTNGSDFLLVRYNSNGSLDDGFGMGGKVITDFFMRDDQANAVALQANGKIVAAGFASKAGSDLDFALARYNIDGSLDNNTDADPTSSFDLDGKLSTDFGTFDDEAKALAIQNDGKIVAAGFSGLGFRRDFALARYNTDGSPDPSFSMDGMDSIDFFGESDTARGVAIERGNRADVRNAGKIVVAGFAAKASGDKDFALARYKLIGETASINVSPLTATFGVVDPISGTFPLTFTITSTGTEKITITDIQSVNPTNFPIIDPPIGSMLMQCTPIATFKVGFAPLPRLIGNSSKITVFGVTDAGTEVFFEVTINGPIAGTNPTPVGNAPTLSQWGTIILSLFVLAAGTAFIARRRPTSVETGVLNGASYFNDPGRPLFAAKVFAKTLAVTLSLVLAGLALVTRLTGFISAMDICGALLCSLIIAYITHLLIVASRDFPHD